MVERILNEVEQAARLPDEPPYPGLVCMSHSWLDVAHPDPQGRNLHEIWLPAIEWYYCERLNRLGTPDAADFGIFVDALSICQKDEKSGTRTEVETKLFKTALGSLDVVYAHQGGVTLLSTRLPKGCDYDEAVAAKATDVYNAAIASGEAASDDWTHPLFLAKCAATKYRPYSSRGWTNFERCVSSLVKPSGQRIDIGIFAAELEKAKGLAMQQASGFTNFAWADKQFKDKSAEQLSMQATGDALLTRLVRATHEAPLSPEAFDIKLATWTFTNGSDKGIVSGLYKRTAEAVLGCTPSLAFRSLKWDHEEWTHLGMALRLCPNLKSLSLARMPTLNAKHATAAIGNDLSLPGLRSFDLSGCTSLTSLPPLDGFPALRTISLRGCRSLRSLPPLDKLPNLQSVDISWCLLLPSKLPNEKELRQRGVEIDRHHRVMILVVCLGIGLPVGILALVLALGSAQLRLQIAGVAGMLASMSIIGVISHAWSLRDKQRALAQYQGLRPSLSLELKALVYPLLLVLVGIIAIYLSVFMFAIIIGASTGLSFERNGRDLLLFVFGVGSFLTFMVFWVLKFMCRSGRPHEVAM